MASNTKSESSAGDKTERLINLVLALLSAKKFLTKSQIFEVVKVRGEAAYQGAIESKDRMFERDKDDLRGMGIHIEVGGLDPLFDDEAGYRIKESQYALHMPELSPEELAALSIAATFWRDSALSRDTQSALRRLNSLGIPADTTNVGLIELRYDTGDQNLELLNEAIDSRTKVSFEYSGQQLSKKLISPYGLVLWNGFWYLLGGDAELTEVRMFKLVRIVGLVSTTGKKGSYLIPTDFSASHYVKSVMNEDQQIARVKVRNGTSITLTSQGREVSLDDGWTIFDIPFDSLVSFARTILWYGADAEVLSPSSLRDYIHKTLIEVAGG